MMLVDTHCHLHFAAFQNQNDEPYQRLREAGMMAITIGTGSKNSVEGLRYADQHEGVYATVGLHPDHVTSDYVDANEGEKPESEITAEQLINIAKQSAKCVAIGECGLDWYRLSDEPILLAQQKVAQERIFAEHLKAAKVLDLPLVIHCREALPRLAELLSQAKKEGWQPRGIIHSFTGTWDEAQPLLELGFSLGINGIATFPEKKNQDPEQSLQRVIERIPLEQLVLETDAPYLAPVPYRGKQNEPALLIHVAEYIARVRGITVEDLAQITTTNAKRVFGI